eukprot:365834-Chlamydomonas_euryale.AAC.3
MFVVRVERYHSLPWEGRPARPSPHWVRQDWYACCWLQLVTSNTRRGSALATNKQKGRQQGKGMVEGGWQVCWQHVIVWERS